MKKEVTGVFENLLNRRYGSYEENSCEGVITKHWKRGTPFSSELLGPADWAGKPAKFCRILEPIYGWASGGFLVGSSLKIAHIFEKTIWGLYKINELWERDEVKRAMHLDSDIIFFMDASNVWYYGYKNGALFVYDCEFDELDECGPIETCLEILIKEWEDAKPK